MRNSVSCTIGSLLNAARLSNQASCNTNNSEAGFYRESLCALTGRDDSRSSPCSLQNAELVQGSTEASILPRQPLLQALIDSYYDNPFHHYPVIDRKEIASPDASRLVVQSPCLAGSIMRQMSDSAEFVRSQATYDKLKTLIYCNYEQDSLSLLKAICLMPIWSPNPPSHVTLAGPWHWTGAATRLAFQMGLHKESTYCTSTSLTLDVDDGFGGNYMCTCTPVNSCRGHG
jgi:hypothetical protein